MSLFIANPTKQNNHFFYRLPEVQRLLDVVIPAGGQVAIGSHLNPSRAQLETLVAQHSEHGLVSVHDSLKIKSGKISLVYSWDKPVDMETINNGLILNDDAALVISDEVRVDQAATIINELSKQIGAEPETADVIVSEIDRSGSTPKTKVVRSVGKGKD